MGENDSHPLRMVTTGGWERQTNESRSSRSDRVLSEVLFARDPLTFDSLATLASNIQAVEASLLFTAGLQTFVALCGPSGWGKSHLLEAVAFRLRSELGRGACRVVSASDWVSGPTRGDQGAPLLLDNVQEALSRARLRVPLKLALERRVKAGKPTLLAFTSNKFDRPIRTLLPMTREWSMATIGAPDESERATILHQIAHSEGLELGPSTVRVLAAGLRGNGRTLRGALKRLKLDGLDWPDDRAALRACGLINPFFADNSAWDLVGNVMRTAAARSDLSSQARETLAVYALHCEAQLPEAEVARAVGIEPAAVYLRTARFEKDLALDPRLRQTTDTFVGEVVKVLQNV